MFKVLHCKNLILIQKYETRLMSLVRGNYGHGQQAWVRLLNDCNQTRLSNKQGMRFWFS